MSRGEADASGFFQYGPHRYKVHSRAVIYPQGQVTMYEVEWQRNWRTLVPMEGEGNPTSPNWESNKLQFDTPEQAKSFAELVLDGEIEGTNGDPIQRQPSGLEPGRHDQGWPKS